jgi:hypothetical protein
LEGGSAVLLKAAEQKLKDLVRRKLDEAIRANDEKEIFRHQLLSSLLSSFNTSGLVK